MAHDLTELKEELYETFQYINRTFQELLVICRGDRMAESLCADRTGDCCR